MVHPRTARTHYDGKKCPGGGKMNMGRITVPVTESKIKVQQHMAEQTDIRFIMKRYRENRRSSERKGIRKAADVFRRVGTAPGLRRCCSHGRKRQKAFWSVAGRSPAKIQLRPQRKCWNSYKRGRERRPRNSESSKKRNRAKCPKTPRKREPHSDPLDVRVRVT